MNKKIVIIGAGGHGKVVADIICKSGDTIKGFLDDDVMLPKTFWGIPVLGKIENYTDYMDCKFVVAIGNPEIREKIVENLCGVTWYTAIHPTAVIADIDVCIGEGTVVMANTVVNAGAQIGKHCIVNSGAVVEHDNKIEDFVHVSVGAKLGGTVHIGKSTWVGIGAVVSNNLTICENCVIRAGAVVIENIVKGGNYQGIPAKIYEER